jgi:hypothetical protein
MPSFYSEWFYYELIDRREGGMTISADSPCLSPGLVDDKLLRLAQGVAGAARQQVAGIAAAEQSRRDAPL